MPSGEVSSEASLFGLQVVGHRLAVSSHDVFCAWASLVSLCVAQLPLLIRKQDRLDEDPPI